jgi:hypothetical protein
VDKGDQTQLLGRAANFPGKRTLLGVAEIAKCLNGIPNRNPPQAKICETPHQHWFHAKSSRPLRRRNLKSLPCLARFAYYGDPPQLSGYSERMSTNHANS